MGRALDHVLRNPAIWRGGEVPRTGRRGIPTGYEPLDQALPEQGWPPGALTEILVRDQGIGELSLLTPALRYLTEAGRPVVLVAPPYLPFARAWEAAGVKLEHLLIVEADGTERLWAAEQASCSGGCGMVLVWEGARKGLDYRALQRLNLAADRGAAACVLYRPAHTGSALSAAPLRLSLSAAGELAVSILKRRGAPLPTPIRIDLYPAHWRARASSTNSCPVSTAAPAAASLQAFPG
ncbi:MAG: translesion DNA synthesis-associated protein ImuA [Betaproteobacteria bacterium]|nr:translesion DNA synthesis-associated protein ImuA [Betaproteobacteria bacterium]